MGNLKGCKVILHDEKSGKTIAETIILEFDRQRQVISVNIAHRPIPETARLSLLILGKHTIVECKGNTRGVNTRGDMEIALFQATEKESREAVRHALKAPARIENIIVAGQSIPLDKPLEVTVLDISASGVQLQTDRSELYSGCCFQLMLKIAGSDTVVNTTVVRILERENGVKTCGCRFLALDAGTTV